MIINSKNIATHNLNSDITVNDKYILILLTKYPGFMAKFLNFIPRWYFTHASIGINDSTDTFFSFVTKGFRIEIPHKHPTAKQKDVPCELYRIPVSDHVYTKVKHLLEFYNNNSRKYRFSYIGVFMCIMRIAYRANNYYFCSQFVAEVLESTKVMKLKKHSSLYTPDDFSRIANLQCVFKGTLKILVNSPKINIYSPY